MSSQKTKSGCSTGQVPVSLLPTPSSLRARHFHTGRLIQSSNWKRYPARILLRSPSLPGGKRVLDLFQEATFCMSPVSKLGKRETRCGASTRISWHGSTRRSSHLLRRAAAILETESSEDALSRNFSPLPDAVTNCRNVVLEGFFVPTCKNSTTLRGISSASNFENPKDPRICSSRFSRTSFVRCLYASNPFGTFNQLQGLKPVRVPPHNHEFVSC